MSSNKENVWNANGFWAQDRLFLLLVSILNLRRVFPIKTHILLERSKMLTCLIEEVLEANVDIGCPWIMTIEPKMSIAKQDSG